MWECTYLPLDVKLGKSDQSCMSMCCHGNTTGTPFSSELIDFTPLTRTNTTQMSDAMLVTVLGLVQQPSSSMRPGGFHDQDTRTVEESGLEHICILRQLLFKALLTQDDQNGCYHLTPSLYEASVTATTNLCSV